MVKTNENEREIMIHSSINGLRGLKKQFDLGVGTFEIIFFEFLLSFKTIKSHFTLSFNVSS